MKKNTLRTLLSVSIMTVMALNIAACGESNENGSSEETATSESAAAEVNVEAESTAAEETAATDNTATDQKTDLDDSQVDDQVDSNSEENAEEVITAVEDASKEASEEDKETESGQVNHLSESKCSEKIDQLLATNPATPDNIDVLKEMASCVTYSRVIDADGVIFSEMDNAGKASLRFQILNSVLWLQTPVHEDIATTVNDETAIPLEDAERIFKDFYGEENFTPYEYERVEDGYVYPLMADGEAWQRVEHMQFFEDDDYILFTGPGFYESNGGDEEFLGYADILFSKNPDSKYGATLLYGRYRNEKINISSVETSSELSASGGKTYSGDNLIDGDYTTVWAEGVSGTGVGETITLHLDKKQLVYGVVICNGYTASYEQFENNGVLSEASADFGDGNTVKGEVISCNYEGYTAENLADLNRTKLELEEPVMTDTIVITITGATSGAKYDDTCVSEVMAY
ncbi:NADase-type glycan-binding domain-containing protein [Butyrivibrio sp. AD3002]|uniref:NADase-type glycan-binding domain-containing protein n=1 Tax=Butyrivibrio sp. AD3002 TaxID=1280670 RepID=UPI0003B44A81|nr:discoidin domain-containing protein [Butyrivibrio sp. AD3002]